MSNDNKNRSSAIWEIHRVFYGAYNKYQGENAIDFDERLKKELNIGKTNA